ncbi:MAG: hypothetical protein ACLGIC_04105 [Acidimicrobiia bacterium]|jgi:hypothetical protein
MPAETHSHSEPVTVQDILDLLSTIVHDDATFDPDTPLTELGLSDDLSIMAFWDVAIEEYGERSVGEPDLDDLASATTAVDLAERTVRNLRATDTAEAS